MHGNRHDYDWVDDQLNEVPFIDTYQCVWCGDRIYVDNTDEPVKNQEEEDCCE